MKILFIAPGVMPIPPNGWGAVEMLIWDYITILKKNGYDVDFINTNNQQDIINKANSNYDIVHLHYDVYIDILDKINSKVKIASSHYPFINRPSNYVNDGYDKIIHKIVNNKNFYIFASSNKDLETFVKFGANQKNTFLSRLGVQIEPYDFQEKHTYDKTLCFSQIVDRKRQYLIQNIDNIDFFGRYDDHKFSNFKNYKGEIARDLLNKEITKYSNFVLLSLEENTTPLVVKEALICGLGVVVSEQAGQELDKDMDFISIIKEEDIPNLDYVKNIIEKNKQISIHRRNEIRNYGINKFNLENILLHEYIPKLESLYKQ